ncbi:glycoside hydrolase family 68 protein [Homoserinibacter sp. GY 40078]|uniref:glycoside hydrolase family 68 protein n=1 Tax=Homoserinibacter sp. GY 40078 TaxID=2603275 RepID=UPI0011CA48F3|nr:glycoside hydrolase family 68 protein [Homoserinibacter sp. GY 40078]TXK19080.1 glycosyl hydrolase family 32 [Homoserinibacter sp. GY 40078]
MSFRSDTHWIWDFWIADDGDSFHMFYLHAPKSLVDPHLRHRNARIGHAVSTDLRSWTDHGEVLAPGAAGSFDETATWTGSVVRGDDGLWRMFYTGAIFLSDENMTNIEAIGVATSDDLHTWQKTPGPITEADPRWYETLADGTWREQAWRDPWVYRDERDGVWHMLITARGRDGDDVLDRGVIGHATSPDLETWTVQPPLSEPGIGFMHLEVPQLSHIDGRTLLTFSCDGPHLTGRRADTTGGVWVAPVDDIRGPFGLDDVELLAPETSYAGRLVQDRDGAWMLLAFENVVDASDDGFGGWIADPVPVASIWSASADATGAGR